jgi:hypothetical protein
VSAHTLSNYSQYLTQSQDSATNLTRLSAGTREGPRLTPGPGLAVMETPSVALCDCVDSTGAGARKDVQKET